MATVRSTLSRADSLSIDRARLFLSFFPIENTQDRPETRHSIWRVLHFVHALFLHFIKSLSLHFVHSLVLLTFLQKRRPWTSVLQMTYWSWRHLGTHEDATGDDPWTGTSAEWHQCHRESPLCPLFPLRDCGWNEKAPNLGLMMFRIDSSLVSLRVHYHDPYENMSCEIGHSACFFTLTVLVSIIRTCTGRWPAPEVA